ncbi:hypothetical protein RZS08_49915, partial [Arthrospira platensis SPKY1]|nr:hypothetical protein [Arthrospira platensis SPKY1]
FRLGEDPHDADAAHPGGTGPHQRAIAKHGAVEVVVAQESPHPEPIETPAGAGQQRDAPVSARRLVSRSIRTGVARRDLVVVSVIATVGVEDAGIQPEIPPTLVGVEIEMRVEAPTDRVHAAQVRG